MNISEVWKLYNESEKRVPEFDTALANLARTLGVTPYDAFKGFAKIMGAEDGISTAASAVSFPLSKRADLAEEATVKALEFLKILESEGRPLPEKEVASEEIKNILNGKDAVAQKGLHEALKIKSRDPSAQRSRFWGNIDSRMRVKLENFSNSNIDELLKGSYGAGDYIKFNSSVTMEKMLKAIQMNDSDAIDDFIKMHNTTGGKELLAKVDARILEEKLPEILKKIEGKGTAIDYKIVMRNHEIYKTLAAQKAARLADTKSFANILSRMFGGGMPVTERLRAGWHGAGEMASLAKSWPKLAAILGLAAAGAAAFGFFKMKGSGGGKDTPSGSSESTGATSGTTSDAASGVSPDIIAGGDIADRVRARLKQVYSGGKK